MQSKNLGKGKQLQKLHYMNAKKNVKIQQVQVAHELVWELPGAAHFFTGEDLEKFQHYLLFNTVHVLDNYLRFSQTGHIKTHTKQCLAVFLSKKAKK